MAGFMFMDRVELCYNHSVPMIEMWDGTTAEVINNASSSNSVPPEFLLPAMLSASSHYMENSIINPWGTWMQPAIIYSTAVGFTGTNKTQALEILQKAVLEVERSQGMTGMSSRLNQCECIYLMLMQINLYQCIQSVCYHCTINDILNQTHQMELM